MTFLKPQSSGIPTLMRALTQPSYAGPVALRMSDDVPVPTPGPGELLIRVTAAGVNFADVAQTRGQYGGGPVPPYVAGFEVAGEVISGGPAVKPTKIGHLVVGIGQGAFAEYAVVPAAATVDIPDGWSPPHALGFILNWATALAAIKPVGRLVAGETVLVHAAAGAVGQAAVRLAKHYRANVLALCSSEKSAIVRALGADIVIDSRDPEWAGQVMDVSDGIDLVLESVGGAGFTSSLAVTRPVTGRVVVFGEAAGVAEVTTHQLIFENQVQLTGLHIGQFAKHAPAAYERVIDDLHRLIRLGVYTPEHVSTHPLHDGSQVLQDLEQRRTIGKQALQP